MEKMSSSRSVEMIERLLVAGMHTTVVNTSIPCAVMLDTKHVTRHSRKSLRDLGSVGEPINPSAWRWYFNVVGDSRCPISDTWWQTETGGFMLYMGYNFCLIDYSPSLCMAIEAWICHTSIFRGSGYERQVMKHRLEGCDDSTIFLFQNSKRELIIRFVSIPCSFGRRGHQVGAKGL